jgi:hypothetical protein
MTLQNIYVPQTTKAIAIAGPRNGVAMRLMTGLS